MTTQIRITYGDDSAIMEWDGAQAAAPIVVDGETTPFQTADARHDTARAVRLVCGQLWGPVYETAEDAAADGRDAATAAITIWDDVGYERV